MADTLGYCRDCGKPISEDDVDTGKAYRDDFCSRNCYDIYDYEAEVWAYFQEQDYEEIS